MRGSRRIDARFYRRQLSRSTRLTALRHSVIPSALPTLNKQAGKKNAAQSGDWAAS
jgi:hypothetical protein